MRKLESCFIVRIVEIEKLGSEIPHQLCGVLPEFTDLLFCDLLIALQAFSHAPEGIPLSHDLLMILAGASEGARIPSAATFS